MPEQSHQGSRGGRADVTNLVGHVQGNSVGPHRFADPVRMFADPDAGPDEVSFHQPNLDEQYYNSGYYFRHQGEVQPFPRPAPDPAHLSLGQILGPKLLQPILDSRSIALHVVGDSGASTSDLIQGEHRVADAMADDVEAGGSAVPAFLFHLGDVVYNFGEGQYYYDQFYEPYRRYDRPIFAIPGNHDGTVYGPNATSRSPPHSRPSFAISVPARQGRRRTPAASSHDDDTAWRLLHARRAVGLDHRAVLQRARVPRGHLFTGRSLPAPGRSARLPRDPS